MQSVLNIPCLHGIDFPLLHRVFCLCRIWKLMLLTEKSAKALTEEVKFKPLSHAEILVKDIGEKFVVALGC